MENKLKFKRITSLVLSLILLSSFSLSAAVIPQKVRAEENKVIFTLDQEVPATRDNEVIVNVVMDSINQPCSNLQFYIDYEADTLEFISGNQERIIWDGGVAEVKPKNEKLSSIKGLAYSNSGENEAINSILFSFKFKVKADAPSGSSPITFRVDEANFPEVVGSSDGGTVPFEFVNGSVMVV